MPNLTGDAVTDLIKSKMVSNNISMYAIGSINAYSSPGGTLVKTFGAGSYIGDVFSFVNSSDGLWWMFSPSNYDPNNPSYYYVKNNPSFISVPMLPDLIQQVQDAKDQQEKDQKGIIPYYIEKYAPYIFIPIAAVILYPSIRDAVKPKTVSGMSTEDNLWELAAGFLVASLIMKHNKGSLIIEDPIGEFPDPVTGKFPSDQSVKVDVAGRPIETVTPIMLDNGNITPTANTPVAQYQPIINFIGPYALEYGAKVSGGAKINLAHMRL